MYFSILHLLKFPLLLKSDIEIEIVIQHDKVYLIFLKNKYSILLVFK